MSEVKKINGYDIKDEQARNRLDNVESNRIKTFKNINDLKLDTELEKDLFIYLKDSYKNNDGNGSFYIIDEKTELDTVDNEKTIIINNELVARKVNNFGGTTARKLYGNYNNAVVQNINNTGLRAQVAGFNPESQMATYTDRDHVITYTEFRTQPPNIYEIVETTETSVTLSTTPTNVYIGSVVDLYKDDSYNKREKYSGFVSRIEENTIYVNHWYYTNNTEEGQVPTSDVVYCAIDMPTKVWVINGNLLLSADSNVQEGVIAEYGLFNYLGENTHPNARANGIDMINFQGKTDFGYMARSIQEDKTKMAIGYFARNLSKGFVARDTDQLIESQKTDGGAKFRITANGKIIWNDMAGLLNDEMIETSNNTLRIAGSGLIRKFSKNISIASTENNEELNINDSSVIILVGSNTKIVPTGTIGQVIEIYSARASNNLTINGTTYPLARYKTVKLISDGTKWIDLNNVLEIQY